MITWLADPSKRKFKITWLSDIKYDFAWIYERFSKKETRVHQQNFTPTSELVQKRDQTLFLSVSVGVENMINADAGRMQVPGMQY